MCLLLLLALQAETEHYRLHIEGLDEKETGRLLEALHARLTKHFGRAPTEKLRVELYSTRERWADALRRDGQAVPNAGGYYAPDTKTAYLFVQPSEYYTRQLLLHEATHQFHYLVATENRNPKAGWYTEGLAEYFGMHDWDGEKLETGVIPAVTLEDYPARALEQFDAIDRDLAGLISGKRQTERPPAWALVHFLMNNHEKRFRALAAKLDRGADPAEAFGSVDSDLAKRYREWIEKHQQAWRVVWTGWQPRGHAIEGAAVTNGIAVLKRTPNRLAVELEPVGKPGLAGLVFGFVSADEFHLFQILDGKARVVRRTAGAWRILAVRDRPARDRDLLELSLDGDRATLSVNGEIFGAYDTKGSVGLNVDSCRVRFHLKD